MLKQKVVSGLAVEGGSQTGQNSAVTVSATQEHNNLNPTGQQ